MFYITAELLKRIKTIPVAYPQYYDPQKRTDAIMQQVRQLLEDYTFRGHNNCPLLWSDRKWCEFLKEKVEESIPLLRYNPDMNLPPGYI